MKITAFIETHQADFIHKTLEHVRREEIDQPELPGGPWSRSEHSLFRP